MLCASPPVRKSYCGCVVVDRAEAIWTERWLSTEQVPTRALHKTDLPAIVLLECHSLRQVTVLRQLPGLSFLPLPSSSDHLLPDLPYHRGPDWCALQYYRRRTVAGPQGRNQFEKVSLHW